MHRNIQEQLWSLTASRTFRAQQLLQRYPQTFHPILLMVELLTKNIFHIEVYLTTTTLAFEINVFLCKELDKVVILRGVSYKSKRKTYLL